MLKWGFEIGAKGWVTPPLRPQRKLLLQHPTWFLLSKQRVENTLGIITRQDYGVLDPEE